MPIIYSVIIPTLNQSAKLRRCLAHLNNLDSNPDVFEVLVIDNGSTDDTKTVTESYSGMIKQLSYHYCTEPGLMAARHMGCNEAKGDILCYLDDDSLVTKEWLNGMTESFSCNDVVIAGGPCIPKYDAPPPDWTDYFWDENEYGKTNGFLSLVDFGNEFKMIPPCHIYGCNFAVRKRIFLEYGGTQPDYYPEKYRAYQGNGESGLTLKLQQKGFWAVYNPMARIDHLIFSSRLTLDYFCWRRYYNGIHASYHDVRRQHGLDVDQMVPVYMPLSHVIIRTIRRPLGCVKRYALSLLRDVVCRSDNTITTDMPEPPPPESTFPEPPEVIDMKRKIEESFRAGYAFHQESLKKDPRLREWVLRPNYLGKNGKLPI